MAWTRKKMLQDAYAAYNRRDSAALLALVREDIDWPDGHARLHGKNELREYWARQWMRTHTHDEVVEIRNLSQDRSIVRVSQVVRALDGSIISQGLFDHMLEIKEALIARLDIHEVAMADRLPLSGVGDGKMTSDAQLVQQLYDGFNARDIDAVLLLLTEDVAWANGMDGGHVRGREAIRVYWTSQWSTISPHVEPMRITQAEDGSINVEVHQVVRDLQGQPLLDETVRHVFRTENGRVSRFDIRSASQLSSIAHGT